MRRQCYGSEIFFSKLVLLKVDHFKGFLNRSNIDELVINSMSRCTVLLNYNFTFTRVDMRGATTKVGMDHIPRNMEYAQLVCSTHVTRMDIPHAIYMHGFSMQCTHVDIDVYLWHCYFMFVLPVAITR